jgi:hypothetical protein
MAASEDGIRHLLLDPDYWKPRLTRLVHQPASIIRTPREDLCRPGIEVVELRLKAHDGASIRALIARSAFHQNGSAIHVRTCGDFDTCAIDWKTVEAGASDVVFPYPESRRLEDRVLDVLRVVQTVTSMESTESRAVELFCGCQTRPDEFRIVDMLRERGWA